MKSILRGKLLDRRYRILQTLAKGGFGETYIAEDIRLPGNPRCVVKHLKPNSNNAKLLENAKRLFLTEAETLQKLGKHDQIPQLLAYFEENREFYLVQELIHGHTLTRELIPGRCWTEQQVGQLLQEVLHILAFIHRQNVIHRDIKPDNLIRRRPDQKLVLVDFGTVKQSVAAQGQASTTIIAGTPGYMPTEQGRGKPRPSSDIYALGIIGIQALTGLKPSEFQEDSATGELLWQPWADCSEAIAAILEKMVRYHFKDRYPSAEEALQDLDLISYQSTFAELNPASVEQPPEPALEEYAAEDATDDAAEDTSLSSPTVLSDHLAEKATVLSLTPAVPSKIPLVEIELEQEATIGETHNIPSEVTPQAEMPEITTLTQTDTQTDIQSVIEAVAISPSVSEPTQPVASSDAHSDAPALDLLSEAISPEASVQSQIEPMATLLSLPVQHSSSPSIAQSASATVLSQSPSVPELTASPVSPLESVQSSPAPRQRRLLIGISGCLAIAAVLGGSLYWFHQRQGYLNAQAALEQIKSLQLAGRYEDCIQQAKAVPSGYSDLKTQFQSVGGDCVLAQAKTLAAGRKFKDAIAQANQISPEIPAYTQAQTLIDQWSEKILQIATDKYRQGNLQEAKAIATAIPADSSLAQKVQQHLQQWQAEWNKNEAFLKTAKQALDKQQWQQALAEINKIKLLQQSVPQTNPYWEAKIQSIAAKAKQELAAAQAAEAARPAQPEPSANSGYTFDSSSGNDASPYSPDPSSYSAPAPPPASVPDSGGGTWTEQQL